MMAEKRSWTEAYGNTSGDASSTEWMTRRAQLAVAHAQVQAQQASNAYSGMVFPNAQSLQQRGAVQMQPGIVSQRGIMQQINMYASQFGMGPLIQAEGAQGGSPSLSRNNVGNWYCLQCGWTNRRKNTICGNGSPVHGCGAPKSTGVLSGGQWVCECGWTNRGQNLICGSGKTGFGCGKARIPATATATAAGMVQYAANAGEWKCSSCGWNNRAQNMHCGSGKPGYGCGNPRPVTISQRFATLGQNVPASMSAEWICTCGWRNRANNNVCGGGKSGGAYGCGAPKPGLGAMAAMQANAPNSGPSAAVVATQAEAAAASTLFSVANGALPGGAPTKPGTSTVSIPAVAGSTW